jgi:hypothetical protein
MWSIREEVWKMIEAVVLAVLSAAVLAVGPVAGGAQRPEALPEKEKPTAAASAPSPAPAPNTTVAMINLPPTTGPTEGVVSQSGTPLVHTYAADGSAGQNLFVGPGAGSFKLTKEGGHDPGNDASFNLAVGDHALSALTTGSWNIGIGRASLQNVTMGTNNVAVGGDTMLGIITGTDNVAVGIDSLRDAEGASTENTALGARAMKLHVSGDENTAVGFYAYGNGASMGTGNTAIGSQAMAMTVTGMYNSVLGAGALYNANGSFNTVMGFNAGNVLTSGSSNNLFGANAGLTLTTGANNIIIGQDAANDLTVGSNNILIGNRLKAGAPDLVNTLNIGDMIKGDLSTQTITRLPISGGSVKQPSLVVGTGAGLYQDGVSSLSFSLGGVQRVAFATSFVALRDEAHQIRFGTMGDVMLRRSSAHTLSIDDGKDGAGRLVLGTPGGCTNCTFAGVSKPIGGTALAAGGCTSDTVDVEGVTSSMVAVASPDGDPGDGVQWQAFVAAEGKVTVRVCAAAAVTPTARAYNVRIIP